MNRICLLHKLGRLLLGFLVISALQGWNSIAQTPETFVPTGSMATPRLYHTATLLKDGRVLIAGGDYAPNPSGLPTLATAELYDPSTGEFSITGSMTTPRELHTATLLPDGRVLITGGRQYIASGRNIMSLASAELYDPVTGTFTATVDMNEAHDAHTATLLNNGKVLINGGSILRRETRPELFDPATGTFSTVDMASSTGKTVRLFDGRILIVSAVYSSMGLLYDPATNTAQSLGPLAQSFPVFGQTATLLPSGKVLIAGGFTPPYGDDVLGHAEVFDPDNGTFQTTASLVVAVGGHEAIRLPAGLVLIVGGEGCLRCAELFDPYTETFRLTGNLTDERYGHTATLLNNGTVLITGGLKKSSTELYIPPLLPPLTFGRTRLRGGESFSATFSGTSVNDDAYYDVRFQAPGDDKEFVALNWQRGRSATHNIAIGMVTGTWTVTGVRPHQIEADHTGGFFPVSATITVSP
jgi:hypothetical protein